MFRAAFFYCSTIDFPSSDRLTRIIGQAEGLSWPQNGNCAYQRGKLIDPHERACETAAAVSTEALAVW